MTKRDFTTAQYNAASDDNSVFDLVVGAYNDGAYSFTDLSCRLFDLGVSVPWELTEQYKALLAEQDEVLNGPKADSSELTEEDFTVPSRFKDEVTVTAPVGTKVKGKYVYLPEVAGKTRWFAVKDIDWCEVDGRINITAERKALTARGLI